MRRLVGALIVLLGTVSVALACQFDTDCFPGSRCVKPPGSLYGVCKGGIRPGNSDDQQPVYDPLDPNKTVGQTCQFDVNCGPGNYCAKEDGAIYGVCLPEP